MHAFDVLGDPVRRRILELLAEASHSSGEIVAIAGSEFGITQSAISQHLKVLREAGLINLVPDGTSSRYAIRSEKIGQFSDDVGALAEGLCGPDSNCCR